MPIGKISPGRNAGHTETLKEDNKNHRKNVTNFVDSNEKLNIIFLMKGYNSAPLNGGKNEKNLLFTLLVILTAFVSAVAAKGTFTVMVPPVSGTYPVDIDVCAAEAMTKSSREAYPKYEKTGSDEGNAAAAALKAFNESDCVFGAL